MFIRLTDSVSVAPQIAPEDCAAARAQGFTAIVNNRPDGEAWDQPICDEMRAAAEAAGLRYTPIPVDHGGMNFGQIEAMAAALDSAGGPLLAYCRSGTRSTSLWALAEAKRGGDPFVIVETAAEAGYDVGALLPAMHRLKPA